MKPFPQRLRTLELGNRYWAAVFVAFFCAYLVPFGSGPTKAVFYLGIALPSILLSTRQDYLQLVCGRHFLATATLCVYALVRAANQDTALNILEFVGALLALTLGALKLPTLSVTTVKRTTLLLLLALFTYVLANAGHQGISLGWKPGLRLAPLFGNMKSVIFCTDLIISALVVYSWCCLSERNYRSLFVANAIVIAAALWILQSRSALPVWLGSMTILLAVSTSTEDRKRVLLYLALLLAAIAVLSGGILPTLFARGDSYRLEIWSGYLSSMRKCSILFGCGWGIEIPFTTADGTAIAHPHSMYVQHLFTGGVIGLALLLIALGLPLLAGIRRAHYAAWALLPGCIAMAFDGKNLISLPNERWFLVTVPLALLIADLSKPTATCASAVANSPHHQ